VESILSLLKLEDRRLGIEETLERITSLFGEWFPGARCTLYRRDAAGNGQGAGLLLEPETLAPGHPYRVAMESGEPIWLSGQESRHGWFPPRSLPPETEVALLPLRLEQESWGLLEFCLPPELDRQRASESMQILARVITQQLHNQRVLSHVVFVDWLTQVYNRSFLDLQLPLEIERATRNGENLALLVADLDNFKQLNDGHGHDTGDLVLKEFAAQIRHTLRKVDMVFRYGGEEFVILLPRLDRESALRAAERLRDAIAAHRFMAGRNGTMLQVTASFGGAIYPLDALTESALFKAADEACYRAKHAGKNRVVFVESPT
jgi:diguanylate cyclase (GGDEF)-like protein